MSARFRGAPAVRGEDGASIEMKDQRDKEKAVAVRARQRVIGRELRRMYDDVVQEPVPDDFLLLLKQIDDGKDKKDPNA
jgi:hypothetical protein